MMTYLNHQCTITMATVLADISILPIPIVLHYIGCQCRARINIRVGVPPSPLWLAGKTVQHICLCVIHGNALCVSLHLTVDYKTTPRVLTFCELNFLDDEGRTLANEPVFLDKFQRGLLKSQQLSGVTCSSHFLRKSKKKIALSSRVHLVQSTVP